MLFCFGLFALLLYNTVVANAECSYTYRNSSQQHIEAQSFDYEKQGFRRCEFLIQLVNKQQHIELNFTRLSGFGLQSTTDNDLQEGPRQEEEEEEEEGRGRVMEGGSSNEFKPHKIGGGGSERTIGESSRSHLVKSTTTSSASQSIGLGSKLSSMVSSQSPPQVPHQATTTNNNNNKKHAYANTNFYSSETVVEQAAPSSSVTGPTVSQHGRLLEGHGQKGPCLPMVEIREVMGEGREETRDTICRHDNTQTPIVFHYASSVRIVYEWEQKQSSGFTLYFDFSNSEYEKCVFKCDGSRCVTKAHLCDGHVDCHDRSDEHTPDCALSTSVASSETLGTDTLVLIVVIPSCVLVVGIVVCVVCLFGRHRWYGVHRAMHQHRGNGHAVHLACPQSQSSEGLTPYSGCSTQDCNEQAVALLPSNHRTHKVWHPPSSTHPDPNPKPSLPCHPSPDPEIGLPPNIPVSPDGEEGYCASQLRLLDRRYRTAHSELFKPPPNKTVFDRESPPPYSLTPSPGTYGCGSGFPPPSPPPPGGDDGGAVLSGHHQRMVRDSQGQAVISRCHTMFSSPSRPALGLQQDRSSRFYRPPHTHIHTHHHHHHQHNNNNTLAGQCGQQPPHHAHGAFTVRELLHPSSPCVPVSLLEAEPGGQRSPTLQTVSSGPPTSPSVCSGSRASMDGDCSPSAEEVHGTRGGDGNGRAASDCTSNDYCRELVDAPPSYRVALSQEVVVGADRAVVGGRAENSATSVATIHPTSSTTACIPRASRSRSSSSSSTVLGKEDPPCGGV